MLKTQVKHIVNSMSSANRLSICAGVVDGLRAADRDTIFWDRALAGFGVRVYPSGRKVYVVQTRAGGAPRRVTIGVHGALDADGARKRAEAVIDIIKAGGDPAAPAGGLTLADLAERYMTGHVAANCNAHTAGIYRGSLDNHILPALGSMPLAAIGRAEIAALHHRLRDRRRARFLAPGEYRRLGAVLAEAEEEGWASASAVAALRLLMLTGCRLNEILTLRWDDVDRTAGEFRLRDGKTGGRMVPLTPTADSVLAGIPRFAGDPWVIAGKAPGTRLMSLTAEWYRIRARAGLGDVRIHDLRHSCASLLYNLAA